MQTADAQAKRTTSDTITPESRGDGSEAALK